MAGLNYIFPTAIQLFKTVAMYKDKMLNILIISLKNSIGFVTFLHMYSYIVLGKKYQKENDNDST